MIKAEVIVVGTELLTGWVQESNSLFLSKELGDLGCIVQRTVIVGDVQADIESAIKQAASRASLILLSGGFGSSHHSVTRKAVSRVIGRRLVLSKRLSGSVDNKEGGGRLLSAKALPQMSLVPNGARLFSISRGQAHAFAVDWKNQLLIGLPAKGGLMKLLFLEEVRPYLIKQLKRRSVIRVTTLRTIGMDLSRVQEAIKDLFPLGGSTLLSLNPVEGGADILIRSIGRTELVVNDTLKAFIDKISERLGQAVYGKDQETLAEVVGRLMVQLGLTVAVAESCTGGLIGHRLTNVPGCSTYLDRALVCYSNESKTNVLGVSHDLLREYGAVSSQVAAAMASGVRGGAKTDIGLSTTGIAGPTGGSKNKPVGLVYFAIAFGEGVKGEAVQFQGDRKEIKGQASQTALDLLRRHLLSRSSSGPG